jgi:hypothetical protein
MTTEVVIDDHWHAILRAVSHEKGRTIAAIAYVTKRILTLSRGDFLVCDASEGRVRSGDTDPKVLLHYLKKGVRIWNHPGLHAKAIVRGGVAIVGSANSSGASANGQLTELVAVLRGRSSVAAVRHRIEALARRSTSLDPIALERLVSLFKPARRFGQKRVQAATQLRSRAWCIGTHYIDENPAIETARELGSQKAHRSTEKLLGRRWTRNYRIDDDLSWPGRSVERLKLGDYIFDVLEGKTLRPPGTLVHVERTKEGRGAVLFICRERKLYSRNLKTIRKRVGPEIFKMIKKAGMRQLNLRQLDNVNEIFGN